MLDAQKRGFDIFLIAYTVWGFYAGHLGYVSEIYNVDKLSGNRELKSILNYTGK